MNRRALGLALALSAAQVAGFLVVAALVPPVAGQELASPAQRIAASLLPHVGNMFMSVATTWYVVFTYFILRATDEARKHDSEPFIQLQWQPVTDVAPCAFAESTALSDRVGRIMARLVESGPSLPDNPSRFLQLELQNVRTASVGHIAIEIEAVLITPEEYMFPVEPLIARWESDNPVLRDGSRLSVTVLDLASIPNSATVRVSIRRLSYRASDSKTDLLAYSGQGSTEISGVAVYGVTPSEPQVSGEGS